MKKYLPIVLTSSAVFLFFFLLFSSVETSKAATATHIVISEVQIEGDTTTDEFIELYNPTGTNIDITGWELFRKTAAIDAEEQLLATLSGTIVSHGFILVAHSGYSDAPPADITYDTIFNVSDNNSVILKDESSTVIDLVGMGTATTKEGAAIDNPIDNRSIERKANSISTLASMAPGGEDELGGNGEDTDDNSTDFVRHISPTLSGPQNSTSNTEPVEASPTPTEEITPTITQTVTPTTSPTVTLTPTTTPTLTVTPSTLTPTPTTEPQIIFPQFQFVCTPKIITFKVFGQSYNFEFPTCRIVRVN